MIIPLIIGLISFFPTFAHSQLWSGTMATARATNWGIAGATITDRTTQCGSTIAAYTGTAATINTAIQNCTAGQYVQLGAGTFNLSSGINFDNKSNVTLRGVSPADSGGTILNFSGDVSCGGFFTLVCMTNGETNWVGGPANGPINWTAGYAVGTTAITLASTPTGLSAGELILLDQTIDSSDQWPDVTICTASTTCSQEGGGDGGRSGRAQIVHATVASVVGTTVNLSEPIDYPNWVSGKSPQAWYASTILTGAGLENVQIRASGATEQWCVMLQNATNSWVKNIQTRNCNRAHVMMVLSNHITVRDSYFYGTENASSQSYGVENYSASYNLIENNILHHIVAPIMFNGGSMGSVAGYNYAFDHYYENSPTQMMGTVWLHEAFTDKVLIEGNSGTAFFGDAVHATHNFATVHRNRWIGWESGKTTQITPIILKKFSRFFNITGNVLGRDATHTGYETGTRIYEFGDAPSPMSGDDSNVSASLFRWGNYDTARDAVSWCGDSGSTGWTTTCGSTSEVPTGLTNYSNSIPVTESLPNSYYLSSKPSWFGSVAWPPIGPDVTGGNDSNAPAGKANKIPAQVCYESLTVDGNGIGTNFDAATCYSASADTTPPMAPSGVYISMGD